MNPPTTLIRGSIDGHDLEKLSTLPGVIDYLRREDLREIPQGRYELDSGIFSGIFALHQEVQTKPAEQCRFETHRKFIDIQVILAGSEKFGVAERQTLEVAADYDLEKDVIFYHAPKDAADVVVNAGNYIVFFPENAHQPGRQIGSEPKMVHKIVFKVPVNLLPRPAS